MSIITVKNNQNTTGSIDNVLDFKSPVFTVQANSRILLKLVKNKIVLKYIFL